MVLVPEMTGLSLSFPDYTIDLNEKQAKYIEYMFFSEKEIFRLRANFQFDWQFCTFHVILTDNDRKLTGFAIFPQRKCKKARCPECGGTLLLCHIPAAQNTESAKLKKMRRRIL